MDIEVYLSFSYFVNREEISNCVLLTLASALISYKILFINMMKSKVGVMKLALALACPATDYMCIFKRK
jgi:hypothetical protein